MINFKLKLHWFKQDLQRLYYKFIHNIHMDLLNNGSMLPQYSKGEYVDVIKKGGIIDIISHEDYSYTGTIKHTAYRGVKKGTIRLIPYQPNHGVMVEFINENGLLEWRSLCDYRKFYEIGSGMRERE